MSSVHVFHLTFTGVQVTGIEVSIEGQPKNLLATFWQQSDVDLSRVLTLHLVVLYLSNMHIDLQNYKSQFSNKIKRYYKYETTGNILISIHKVLLEAWDSNNLRKQ